MKDYGLVSVITPSYNCAQFIGETIESVKAQTYTDWEMIIVDDCSSDGTSGIVEGYAREDARIRLLKLERNSGAAFARTKAMQLANGHYMAFLDSDDLWMPEKLERQLSFMTENGYAFSCTSYVRVDVCRRKKDSIVKAPKKVSYNRVLLDCPVGNSTVMYDVAMMGKFEVPDIRKRNDDALWLKMLKVERYIWGMPDILMQYRIRPGSISSNKLSLVKYHWILYRDIEHLSVIRSLFHIGVWGFLKVFHIK